MPAHPDLKRSAQPAAGRRRGELGRAAQANRAAHTGLVRATPRRRRLTPYSRDTAAAGSTSYLKSVTAARHLELQTGMRYREICLPKQSLRGRCESTASRGANSAQTNPRLCRGFVVLAVRPRYENVTERPTLGPAVYIASGMTS